MNNYTPAFPEDVKAKTNSPVVLGGVALLSATDIAGATYLWTAPASSASAIGSLNNKSLQIPNVTEAYAGEYKVAISYGGCTVESKTTLSIAACDNLYIRAFDPVTNLETNKLTRKPNVPPSDSYRNEYEPLILQVETLDGKILKSMNYTWNTPAGISLSTSSTEPYKVQTNAIGHYAVQASSAGGSSCPLSIDIFAEKCEPMNAPFNCGGTGLTPTIVGASNIANLAVGDEFTIKDYTVTVSKISGSQAAGWTGEGALTFNFLKIAGLPTIEIPISVTFAAITVNQCYQLVGGVVKTKYDPTWGSVRNIGEIQDELLKIKESLIDLLKSGKLLNDPQILSLNTRLGEIKTNDIIKWESDVRTNLTNNITNVQSAISCTNGNSNTKVAACDEDEALVILTGIDLIGYETIIHNLIVENNNLPIKCGYDNNSFSLCSNDKIFESDARFDSKGKERFNSIISRSENTHWIIYNTFVLGFGAGYMSEHFKNGNGKELDVSEKPTLINNIYESEQFIDFSDFFTQKIKTKILSNQISQINAEYIMQGIYNPNFSIKKYLFPTQAYAAIGGTQYSKIKINLYRKKGINISITDKSNYIFDYQFEFKDTYGADFDDINGSNSKGIIPALNAFFVLQHNFSRYKPYYVKFKINKTFRLLRFN